MSSTVVSFDVFEVDLRAGELRKEGRESSYKSSPSMFCLSSCSALEKSLPARNSARISGPPIPLSISIMA